MDPQDTTEDESLGGLDDNCSSLTLTSSDQKKFTIERKHAFISKLVKISMDQDEEADDVPIPGVSGNVLAYIVEYMKHHKGTEPDLPERPLKSKHMKDLCKDHWDATFIDTLGKERLRLYEVILAANYMDMNKLMHLCCIKVATSIKNQPLEKIKALLHPDYKETSDQKSV